MTTAVEVYASDFFGIIETQTIIEFCDVFSSHFRRFGYNRHLHLKSKIHSATPINKSFQDVLALITE